MKNARSVQQEGQPWWRFGLVWMVLAGPAVVVVAGFITLYIAVTNPDPVLTVTPRSAMQERQGITHAPAMQGRNHAATGELPNAAVAPAAPPVKP
ncbi:nitrogen fixation protein FixH [Limnohabitans sp.]|uniref:nitrogen fixation protein FixH n=1 Tax=Limnohabitans sp. TaxID=1907725 RepID=UPI0033408ECC